MGTHGHGHSPGLLEEVSEGCATGTPRRRYGRRSRADAWVSTVMTARVCCQAYSQGAKSPSAWCGASALVKVSSALRLTRPAGDRREARGDRRPDSGVQCSPVSQYLRTGCEFSVAQKLL